MATIIASDLWVCTDCAQIIANGEIRDGREDDGQSVADAQVAVWGELAIGLVLDYGEDEDEDNYVIAFSAAPCDGCGELLASERMRAAVIA